MPRNKAMFNFLLEFFQNQYPQVHISNAHLNQEYLRKEWLGALPLITCMCTIWKSSRANFTVIVWFKSSRSCKRTCFTPPWKSLGPCDHMLTKNLSMMMNIWFLNYKDFVLELHRTPVKIPLTNRCWNSEVWNVKLKLFHKSKPRHRRKKKKQSALDSMKAWWNKIIQDLLKVCNVNVTSELNNFRCLNVRTFLPPDAYTCSTSMDRCSWVIRNGP